MERDGVAAKPPNGRGERAWWLGQLVEAAPLSTWRARFGGRSEQEIVALPVLDDWQRDCTPRGAGRRYGSGTPGGRGRCWARRRSPWRGTRRPRRRRRGTPTSPVAVVGDPAKLLSILPPEERAEWVADFIATHGLSEAFQMLGVCEVPWRPLGRAVVDALDIAREAGSYPWSFSGVMGLAERCLDPAAAEQEAILSAARGGAAGQLTGGAGVLGGGVPAADGHAAAAGVMLGELDGRDPGSESP